MFSPLVPWMAALHQETLQEEARGYQLAARSRADQARLEVRVLVGLGVFLITMGLRLHEGRWPKMGPAPKSCGPACG